MRIAGVDYVGRGFQKSKKMAQTYAARNMVNHLCSIKRMNPRELYKVSSVAVCYGIIELRDSIPTIAV